VTTVTPPKVAGHGKSKAGRRVGTSGKKPSRIIQVADDVSTDLSDLVSGSDRDGKADGSVEESEGDLAQDSDDDFDGAKLTEKEAKRVLHNEVRKKN
jgi:hypothetical protein